MGRGHNRRREAEARAGVPGDLLRRVAGAGASRERHPAAHGPGRFGRCSEGDSEGGGPRPRRRPHRLRRPRRCASRARRPSSRGALYSIRRNAAWPELEACRRRAGPDCLRSSSRLPRAPLRDRQGLRLSPEARRIPPPPPGPHRGPRLRAPRRRGDARGRGTARRSARLRALLSDGIRPGHDRADARAPGRSGGRLPSRRHRRRGRLPPRHGAPARRHAPGRGAGPHPSRGGPLEAGPDRRGARPHARERPVSAGDATRDVPRHRGRAVHRDRMHLGGVFRPRRQ